MEMVKTKGISKNFENLREFSDIYSSGETLRFDKRHPIFKTLMKLEFEDVIRSFLRK
jgi:hypothetical protein